MSVFLIADDSQGKAMMLEAVVKHSQKFPTILIAKTTQDAKALIDSEQIAAAFIDYEMPTENGPAVIAYLKEKQPNSRIALTTSSDSADYEKEAMAAGAEAFVCTTRDEKYVLETLRNLLIEWAG
ncbi:response regulator [Candidatus Peregrinibacteria bacterium]|nr:response regulator [Candidatus Peregrinibacteria bacterium]